MVSVADALSVVSRLLCADPAARGEAFDSLTSWGGQPFSAEVVEVLFAAAEGTYPQISASVPVRPNEALIAVMWPHARSVPPEVVVHHLPRLRDDARWAALRLLAENPSAKATVLLGQQLRGLAAEDVVHPPTYPVLQPLQRRPDDADVLGPGLLALLRNPTWLYSAAGVLIAFAGAGTLDRAYSQDVAAAVRPRVAYYQSELRDDWDSAGPDVRWDERSDYADRRATLGLLLNLLGSLHRVDSSEVLLAAVSHPDPWIALWAGVGLVHHGHLPPAEVLVRVAADPECRMVLVRVLEDAGRLDLIPPELRTQDLLAQSEMVRWLIYPTELGRAPDEIEAVTVRPVRHAEGIADLHVFRFRTHEPHWAAGNGWMVGVAGPYLRAGQPTSRSLNATFSRFEPYDPENLHESVQAILGTLTGDPPRGETRPDGPAPWRPFRRRRS